MQINRQWIYSQVRLDKSYIGMQNVSVTDWIVNQCSTCRLVLSAYTMPEDQEWGMWVRLSADMAQRYLPIYSIYTYSCIF